MNKILIGLLLSLYYAIAVSGAITDEGAVFRKLEQARVLEQTVPLDASTPVSVPPIILTPPPPPFPIIAPPPNAITNRAALYNYPIPLADGETLTYVPGNTFQVIGAPPSVGPEIANILEGDQPLVPATPTATESIDDIGQAISSIPGPLRQSFVNLVAPSVKNEVPSIEQAAQANGLQTTDSGSSSSTPPTPPSAGAKTSVSMILLGLLAAIFFSL